MDDLRDGQFGAQIREQCGVLTVAAAVARLGRPAVRWRLDSGRWQRPCRGVLVTHSGALSPDQELWVAVLAGGAGAVLGGLTAAQLAGLKRFEDRRIHLVVPAPRQVRTQLRGVTVHRSSKLGPADRHPARRPPRTRLPRSLLDAAAWMNTDTGARAVLAAGVQQRLVRVDQLAAELQARGHFRRRALISSTLADIAGGAEALSELEFCRLIRRYRLPQPERQVMREDLAGRRRWLDAYWDRARLVAEVDGMWHMDALAWWADMCRDNELTVNGYRLLRFPAFAVREQPGVVAAQIAGALRLAAD